MESEEFFLSRDVENAEDGEYRLTFGTRSPYSDWHFCCRSFFSNLDASSLLTTGRTIRIWTTQGCFVHEIEVWIENDENVIDKETKKQLHCWVPVWSCRLKKLSQS